MSYKISNVLLINLALVLSIKVAVAMPSKLPQPVTNNAVAHVSAGTEQYIMSFSGLGEQKTYQDVHNKVYVYQLSKKAWRVASPVPIEQPVNGLSGRLASVATAIGQYAYVFGGYTVAKDHSEVSVPDVYKYDPKVDKYQQLSPMPVPVDDTIALTYLNRYIYLVSGWHNDGNVNLVQVYDTKTNSWQQASPFPGKPVFGQAGGIVGNTMIICDGVKVDYHPEKRRSFSAEPACYKGEIKQGDITKISWTTLVHPTGNARYRMAAMGDTKNNTIVFIGGSDNPYNYNGIGYNSIPSSPSSQLWQYNLSSNEWQVKATNNATMDHRALIKFNGVYTTIGGMSNDQQVLDSFNQYHIK